MITNQIYISILSLYQKDINGTKDCEKILDEILVTIGNMYLL